MLSHRQNNVLTGKSGETDTATFGDGFTVNMFPVGARASTSSGGTTATVDPGHSFQPGGKVLIVNGLGTATVTSTFVAEALDSVTATTLVWASATPTIATGDLLVNLGPDTSSGATPNFDASKFLTFVDPDGGTATATASTVSTDVQGNYEYYHRGDGRHWEVIRDAAGIVKGVVNGYTGVGDRINIADFGAAVDGSTDDTGAASAAALAQEDAGGGVIWVPAGRTVWKGLSIVATNITIDGEGPQASVILSTGDGSSAANRALTVDMVSFLVLSNFTIRNVGFQQDTNALASGGSIVNLTDIQRLVMDNCTVTAPTTGPDLTSLGIAVLVDEVNGPVNITNCSIRGHDSSGFFLVGIDLYDDITSNRGHPNITGCLIDRCTTGIRIGNSELSNLIDSCLIQGCKIIANGSGNPVAGTIGIDIGQQAIGTSIRETTIEGYDECIRIEAADNTTISGVLFSQFDVDANSRGIVVGTTGPVDGLIVENVRFSSDTDLGTCIELGAVAVSNARIDTGIIVTHTSILVDNSLATSVRKLIQDGTDGYNFFGSLMNLDANTGITALAGGANPGTLLTANVNDVTVSATNLDSVSMPPAFPGRQVIVANRDTTESINVFPASGDKFNNSALDIPIALLTQEAILCWGVNDQTWIAFRFTVT